MKFHLFKLRKYFALLIIIPFCAYKFILLAPFSAPFHFVFTQTLFDVVCCSRVKHRFIIAQESGRFSNCVTLYCEGVCVCVQR